MTEEVLDRKVTRRRTPFKSLKITIKSLKESTENSRVPFDFRKVYYSNPKPKSKNKEDTTEAIGSTEKNSIAMTPLGLISIATECETNLSIAACGIQIIGELSHDEIIELIDRELCMKHYRFRCVVESRKFILNSDFNVKNHVKYFKLSDHGEEDENLRETISHFLNVPLPKNQPLWECLVIEGHSKGQFLFFRIHHSIGDGTSLSSCFLGMCDQSLDEIKDSLLKDISKSNSMKKRNRKRDKLFYGIKKIIWIILGTVIVLFKWTVELLKGRDAPNIFNRGEKLGLKKKTAFISNHFKIEETKKVGKAIGATINDIMLSCICSGMSTYINKYASEDDIGVKTLRKEMKRLRISIPVNIRKEFIATKLRNLFGFVVLRVPMGGTLTPNERLKLIKYEMDTIKMLPEAHCTFYLGRLLNILPVPVLGSMFKDFGRMLTFIFTNMRGSPKELSILGRRIDNILGFVPCPSGSSVGFALVSYENNLTLTVIVDEKSIGNPSKLLQCIKEEYDYLVKHTIGDQVTSTLDSPISHTEESKDNISQN